MNRKLRIPYRQGVSIPPQGQVIRIWHEDKWQTAIRVFNDVYFVGITVDPSSNVPELLGLEARPHDRH